MKARIAFRDDAVTLYLGDVREVLRQLPPDSMDCCVTSPPYWALRDYGLPTSVWDGKRDCPHRWGTMERGRRKDILPLDETALRSRVGVDARQGRAAIQGGRFCVRCRAWAGQLGLEPTPDLYVRHMVAVFREVHRVLKPTGTLWLNLGDCHDAGTRAKRDVSTTTKHGYWNNPAINLRPKAGLKPKDLVGVPWRVALAMQADGWWLRSDIIWSKPNPMPESVRDRPTRSHEYLFLLAKSDRYYYDAEAVREPCESGPSDVRKMVERRPRIGGKHMVLRDAFNRASSATPIGQLRAVGDPSGRNRRTVWTIATQAYRGAHFATFPERLVEPCVLAGSSEAGCCSACGAPLVRQVEVAYENVGNRRTNGPRSLERRTESAGYPVPLERRARTLAWLPSCDCDAGVVPATVLDPFAGSGTTLVVAARSGRRSVGIELSGEYAGLAKARVAPASALRPAKSRQPRTAQSEAA